jgi:glycosyltransferase involved in cell wall biosynthesis
MELQTGQSFARGTLPLDVSIVMPCLNEAQSLRYCIANALDALDLIFQTHGLAGEVVIADNGSTDGSQALAASLGARIVNVNRKGYGAAITGGFDAAYGRFLVMGDCDGSYDFTDAVAMIGRLLDGADLCMGSRFKGGIAPGAMPWKNRYIGNPVLTGMLNLFFRSGIDDAHCGLRAIRKDCYAQLGLTSDGMEFASEMVIKASLVGLAIEEVAATLSPDLRDRAPHLRPWRDGWRHLRYLFMLSPTWVFGVPALLSMGLAAIILVFCILHQTGLISGTRYFGDSWVILGGFMAALGHLSLIMALATHLYGVNQGYRKMRPVLRKHGSWLTLESTLLVGAGLIALSAVGFVLTGFSWARGGFVALPSVLPITLAAVTGAIGCQTVMGGFLLAIIVGHKARIVEQDIADHDATVPAVSAQIRKFAA